MIIGLIGRLQTGKSTIAEMICDKILDCRIIGFADLLKQMIFNAGICNEEELWCKKTDFSRMILQKIGTNLIRDQIDQNFWVKKMKSTIENIYLDYPKLSTIIIHDIRFKNELTFIRQNYKSKIISIKRPSLEFNKDENLHISETELSNVKDFDYQIINDGTLEDLDEKIIKIVNEIKLESNLKDLEN